MTDIKSNEVDLQKKRSFTLYYWICVTLLILYIISFIRPLYVELEPFLPFPKVEHPKHASSEIITASTSQNNFEHPVEILIGEKYLSIPEKYFLYHNHRLSGKKDIIILNFHTPELSSHRGNSKTEEQFRGTIKVTITTRNNTSNKNYRFNLTPTLFVYYSKKNLHFLTNIPDLNQRLKKILTTFLLPEKPASWDETQNLIKSLAAYHRTQELKQHLKTPTFVEKFQTDINHAINHGSSALKITAFYLLQQAPESLSSFTAEKYAQLMTEENIGIPSKEMLATIAPYTDNPIIYNRLKKLNRSKENTINHVQEQQLINNIFESFNDHPDMMEQGEFQIAATANYLARQLETQKFAQDFNELRKDTQQRFNLLLNQFWQISPPLQQHILNKLDHPALNSHEYRKLILKIINMHTRTPDAVKNIYPLALQKAKKYNIAENSSSPHLNEQEEHVR